MLAGLTENILSLLRRLLHLAVVRFNQVNSLFQIMLSDKVYIVKVPQSMMLEQFRLPLCSHTSVMELWLLTIQCLSHLGNKGYNEVGTSDRVTVSFDGGLYLGVCYYTFE